MTLTNPSLIITFLGGDISPERSDVQTIASSHIITHSLSLSFQLLDGLKSSSNQVSLQVAKDCESIEDIIATDGDIQAELKDGNTTLFTGYISTNFTWTVTDSGEQALKLTIEDTSTRLFTKPFIISGHHLFNSTAMTAIRAVCASAGVTVSESAITVEGNVTKVVDSSMSCKDILTQMLYELGYAYYCDNLGELRFFKIDCASVSGLPVIDKTKLYTKGGQAVSLSKKIRQYRSVRMTFKALGTASDYLVYRNTTNQDDTHPYCNLSLASGEHFDGLEIYTAQQWAEETADQFREDALVEACNAASETSLVGSGKIISVSSVTMIAGKGSDISASIVAMGGPYLKINAENGGNSSQAITRLDAYGSIVFEKSTEVIRTGIAGSVTDSLYSEELQYIHTRELATKHANLVNQFQAYSNSRYTFYAKESLDCGSLIRLKEDQFSGLDVNVLIIGKNVATDSDLVKYTAVGISVFDLNKDVYHQNNSTPGTDTRGSSAEIQYALGSSPTDPPIEEMLWNDEPMMWNGEQMVWTSAEFSKDVPALIDGYYIWMRTRVGDGRWQYSRLTGEQGEDGEPATVFDFSFGSGTFAQNRRIGTSQAITITSDIQNLSVTPTWACYVDGVLNNNLFDNASNPTYLTIPYKNSYSVIRVVMSATGQTSVEHSLSAVDKTQDPNGMYIGELAALPATPWTQYISGDYFIVKTAFTDDEDSYAVGVAYEFDGSSWFNQLNLSLATSMSKAVDCLGGALKSGIAVPSTAALWGWFKNFVAMNAVIQNFFARNVTVGDGTGLAGSGFRFRAHAYASDGTKLSTPIFDVMYGDTTVFKVEPSTGKIYFGTGFYYDPSDGAIHSTDDFVIIDSDGKLSAVQADIDSATINGANITNAFLEGSIDCPSFSSLPEETSSQSVDIGSTAKNQRNNFRNNFSSVVNEDTGWIRCKVVYGSNTDDTYVHYYKSGYTWGYEFQNGKKIYGYPAGYDSYSYYSDYAGYSTTVTIYNSGTVFTFKGLPTSSTGLSSGRVWNDNGTLKIVT